jgi:hypothetical protein
MIKQKANMIFSRRSFIASLTGAAVMPKSLFSSITPTFDESSAIFLADTHISGEGRKKMLNFLRSTIAEILRMQPLPRHVFLLGDVAYNVGKESDYKRAFSELKLLSDAGIKLTIGMGNHDHRKAFLEYWPEYKTRSLVEGEILTATSLPHYDIIMLDSLNETGGIGKLNVDTGAISKKSQEWILENAPRVARMKEPFTEIQYFAIKRDFDTDFICDLLMKMHNYEPLLTKNRNANLTFRNWAKRQQNDESSKPTFSASKTAKPSNEALLRAVANGISRARTEQ